MEKLVVYNQLLLVIYQLLISGCAMVSVYTFTRSDAPGRYFRLLLLAGFLVELLALYEQRHTERNSVSYFSGAIAAHIIIALYYWQLPPLRRRRLLLWLWLMCGLCMGLYCCSSASDFTAATIQYLWFLGVGVLLLSLVCLYTAIVKSRLQFSNITTWIALLQILYWAVLLLSYSMIHIAAGHAPGTLPAITCGILLTNIAFYACAIFIVYKPSFFNANI
jgi:hypothetical protein